MRRTFGSFCKEGLFEEEANRDLEKAATAYETLASQYDSQRALAATALYHLAEIRARQGRQAAAVALYQRVLTEFPAMETLAKLSRDRLTAVGAAVPPAATGATTAPTQEEADELARIREMAKNSPDLLNSAQDELPLNRAAGQRLARGCPLPPGSRGKSRRHSPCAAAPLHSGGGRAQSGGGAVARPRSHSRKNADGSQSAPGGLQQRSRRGRPPPPRPWSGCKYGQCTGVHGASRCHDCRSGRSRSTAARLRREPECGVSDCAGRDPSCHGAGRHAARAGGHRRQRRRCSVKF